jgi:hypothetical protein
VVQQGDELVLRILRVDSFRHRLSLSLKRVSPQQRDEWLAQGERGQTGKTDEASDASSESQDAPPTLGYATEEATHAVSERSVEEGPLDVSPPAVASLPDDEGLWNSLLEEAETALPGRSG